MSEECGCYNTKTNRHEFSYTEEKVDSNEPEKTLRIPVVPVNPKDEIVMLARAIAKRLIILAENSNNVEAIISMYRNVNDGFDTSLEVKTSGYHIL